MDKNSERIGSRIYRWLSYLVASTFIVLGLGILTNRLLPEPFLTTGYQRWMLGGVILIYGSARLVSIYLKSRRTMKNKRSEGIS